MSINSMQSKLEMVTRDNNSYIGVKISTIFVVILFGDKIWELLMYNAVFSDTIASAQEYAKGYIQSIKILNLISCLKNASIFGCTKTTWCHVYNILGFKWRVLHYDLHVHCTCHFSHRWHSENSHETSAAITACHVQVYIRIYECKRWHMDKDRLLKPPTLYKNNHCLDNHSKEAGIPAFHQHNIL